MGKRKRNLSTRTISFLLALTLIFTSITISKPEQVYASGSGLGNDAGNTGIDVNYGYSTNEDGIPIPTFWYAPQQGYRFYMVDRDF